MSRLFLKITFGFMLMLLSVHSYAKENYKQYYQIAEQKFNEGHYQDAMIENMKALHLAEEKNNCDEKAYASMQVGKMHYYLKDKKLALEWFYKTKDLVEKCDIDSLKHRVYHNLVAMYAETFEKDSTVLYMNKTIRILERINKYLELSRLHSVMADFYMHPFKDHLKAEQHIIKAEKYALLSKDQNVLAFAMIKRAYLYQYKNKYPEALSTFKKALKIYTEVGNVEMRMYALTTMTNLMALMRHKDCSFYLATLLRLKDSVYVEESSQKLAEFQTLYEVEKKESANKLLTHENELKQLQINARNRTLLILCIVFILLVIIALWRINSINLKRKNQELIASKNLHKEKERISRDLHDNVGGQLSYVLYSLDGINEEDHYKRKEISGSINHAITNVIGSLRETIWAIHDEEISMNDFSDRLKVYVRKMFRNTNTEVNYEENIVSNLTLNSLIGLNLYRICQEIVHNVFKHARATELYVNINCNDDITIVIRDNGIGFPDEINSQGLGLMNIKGRAEESGIELRSESKSGEGVTYTLIVQTHYRS